MSGSIIPATIVSGISFWWLIAAIYAIGLISVLFFSVAIFSAGNKSIKKNFGKIITATIGSWFTVLIMLGWSVGKFMHDIVNRSTLAADIDPVYAPGCHTNNPADLKRQLGYVPDQPPFLLDYQQEDVPTYAVGYFSRNHDNLILVGGSTTDIEVLMSKPPQRKSKHVPMHILRVDKENVKPVVCTWNNKTNIWDPVRA